MSVGCHQRFERELEEKIVPELLWGIEVCVGSADVKKHGSMMVLVVLVHGCQEMGFCLLLCCVHGAVGAQLGWYWCRLARYNTV